MKFLSLERSGHDMYVVWKGDADSEGLIPSILLKLGFPVSLPETQGQKQIEICANIDRQDIPLLVNFIRDFFTARWAVHILKPIALHSTGSRQPGYSRPSSKTTFHFLQFTQTTLPQILKNKQVRYYLKIYQIEDTPAYPAKVEVIAIAPYGVWLTMAEAEVIKRAMAGFLIALLHGAEVASMPLYGKQNGKAYNVSRSKGTHYKGLLLLDAVYWALGVSRRDDRVVTHSQLRVAIQIITCRILGKTNLSRLIHMCPYLEKEAEQLGRDMWRVK
ncbi:MAG: hypothetical protein PHR77_04780 [Kiritimatiellae bacterium]|nr:hypothetical protein [Kiritimatiellia bacterium]